MSEQVMRDKQAVIDVVVVGDIAGLAAALKRLSSSDPAEFAKITSDLLNTEQREQYAIVSIDRMPDVFHADSRVHGAVYTNGDFLCKRAHPSGCGLPIDEVRTVVEAVRHEYDQSVRDRVAGLKEQFEQIENLLGGHSFADRQLAVLARAELRKGHALLVAAITK